MNLGSVVAKFGVCILQNTCLNCENLIGCSCKMGVGTLVYEIYVYVVVKWECNENKYAINKSLHKKTHRQKNKIKNKQNDTKRCQTPLCKNRENATKKDKQAPTVPKFLGQSLDLSPARRTYYSRIVCLGSKL